MNENLTDICEGILDGNVNAVTTGVNAAIENNIPTEEILQNGLITAMAEVEKLFEAGEFFVPEMLIAARAMQASLAILKPKLLQEDVKSTGKVILGTVKGDLHDIGKNLVGMMLEGAGFDIEDLGTDVPPEKFVEPATQDDVDIVAMSALLTTTMSSMAETVKVIIGGAPVTDDYTKEIGADGYASDTSKAWTKSRLNCSL